MTYNPYMTETKVATIGQLFGGYLSYLQARSADSLDHATRVLDKVSAVLGSETPIGLVTPQAIMPILSQTYSAGSKAQAAWMRALLRTVWNWGRKVVYDYRNPSAIDYRIKENPLDAIPADYATLAKVRDRYIITEELPCYLKYLDSNMKKPAAGVLLVALLTGARIEEISDLNVSDYNSTEATLLFREVKTGGDYKIGIGKWATTILDRWCEGKLGNAPIFPSPRDPHLPISIHSIYYFFGGAGLDNCCPRDTRRTFKTLAQVAGVDRLQLDIIQQHNDGSIAARHYDKYYLTTEAFEQMRIALNLWEGWLKRLHN